MFSFDKKDKNADILLTLEKLIENWENEVVEFNEEAYQKWIISYLETYKKAKKQDIIQLLAEKLPDTLSEAQKEAKIKNILQKMKQNGIITTDSSNKRLANWILVK